MAPKGGNAKKEAGRAKKAENEAKKANAAAQEKVRIHSDDKDWLTLQCRSLVHSLVFSSPRIGTTFPCAQERKEAESWKDDGVKGGKAKKQEQEEKRKADLARKAENARLLAEEEADAPAKVKAAPKAGSSKGKKPAASSSKPAGPGAIAAGGGLGSGSGSGGDDQEVESFAATGIDNALDLLEVVTAKMDKASVGQQAAGIERHPEVRFHTYCSNMILMGARCL